jgi:hypothetical protein
MYFVHEILGSEMLGGEIYFKGEYLWMKSLRGF